MKNSIKIDHILRSEIEKRKLSQAYLANKVKVSKSTLNGYLYGAIPSGVISLVKIAEYLEMSVDELIFGKTRASRGELSSRNEQRLEIIIREQ